MRELNSLQWGGCCMGKMVFVVDLGHFKDYRFSKTEQATPHLELIDSFDIMTARTKMSEKVSVGPGRFGGNRGGRWSLKACGEAHD